MNQKNMDAIEFFRTVPLPSASSISWRHGRSFLPLQPPPPLSPSLLSSLESAAGSLHGRKEDGGGAFFPSSGRNSGLRRQWWSVVASLSLQADPVVLGLYPHGASAFSLHRPWRQYGQRRMVAAAARSRSPSLAAGSSSHRDGSTWCRRATPTGG
jgi:hypothetical protein